MNQFVARFGNDPSIQGAITTDYIYIQWSSRSLLFRVGPCGYQWPVGTRCDSGVFVFLLLDLEGHYSMIVLVEVAQK